MKYLLSGIVIVSLMFLAEDAFAQRRMPPRPDEMGKRPGRLEKFRKMRLIEVLHLNEEDAVRFFAKQSAHEENVRTLMQSRNDLLDDIEHIVRSKGDMKKLDGLTDQVLAIDQKVFGERQRYQDELRKFLTPEQFATYLAFERNFGRQVRDAMEELHQDRRQRGDD
ncbi:MAG: hypothetical protein HYR76_12910 [Ignavibacteria bacterium]|nr:hypothetical protein [Ignavibacteria bacterium]MBI3766375.1 hypothetical protein [Ignavibacteriales bacterium]